MTELEAVVALNAIKAGDPEAAHGEADDILLEFVPAVIAEAWIRAANRVGGFWYA